MSPRTPDTIWKSVRKFKFKDALKKRKVDLGSVQL